MFDTSAAISPLTGDVDPADNSASFAVGTGPDLFVEKIVMEGDFVPGAEVTYLLRFGNAQPGHSQWYMQAGFSLSDVLPDDMTFESANMHYCGDGLWCNLAPTITVGKTNLWTFDPWPAGAINEMLITVKIDDDVADELSLVNTASIVSNNSALDKDPFAWNNTSSVEGIIKWVLPYQTYLPMIIKQ